MAVDMTKRKTTINSISHLCRVLISNLYSCHRYSTCPGTALVVFDNVKVPVENVLGKVNDGFKLIM